MANNVRIYKLSVLDRIAKDGQNFRYVRRTEHGYLLRRDQDDGLAETITFTEFHAGLLWGKIVVHDQWYGEAAAVERARVGDTCLSTIDAKTRRRLHLRIQYCTQFLYMEEHENGVTRSDEAMLEPLARIFAQLSKIAQDATGKKKRFGKRLYIEAPPTPSTLRTWLRAYEKGGYQEIALLDTLNRSGNTLPKADEESLAICAKYAKGYASTNKTTMIQLHREYEAEMRDVNRARILAGKAPLDVVSYTTMRRLVKARGAFYNLAGREGEETARQKAIIVGRGMDILWPGQRVEIDEWEVALHVLLVKSGLWAEMTKEERKAVKRVRLWVTLAIDCATRCVLAAWISSEAPSSASGLAALEMSLVDKTSFAKACGSKTPWDMCLRADEYAVDNATWLNSEDFTAGIMAIRSKKNTPAAGMPCLRATIERGFGTFEMHFLQFFTGRTFENVVRKGKYNAQGNASINVEEFRAAFIRYITDVYHNTPHSGLGGETPHDAWLRLTQSEGLLAGPSHHVRRNVFGVELERTIDARGVLVMGLHYQSPELQRLRLQDDEALVRVKSDRFNLQHISVWNGEGWLTVGLAADDLQLQDVTMWEWITAVRNLSEHFKGRAAAKADVVMDAIRDIRLLGDQAVKFAELRAPIMTAEDYERIEARLFRSFTYGSNYPMSGDVLDDDEDSDGVPAPVITAPAPTHKPKPTATVNPDIFGDEDDDGFGSPETWSTKE